MTPVESGSRVALVTGGVRGIGRAIVAALVADGWVVAFTHRNSPDPAKAVEAAHDGRARAFALDLRDRDRPDALVREVTAALGPVTGLVNNAGVRHDSLLAMTPDADWDAVQDTNLGGAFRCSRAVLPGMVAQRHGAIVNISSLAGVSGFAGQSAYAASKAALIGMSKSLAREMAKRRIRVNVVVPGYVATDMTADLTESVSRELRDLECLPDGTSPEDVAAVVVFLLSDRAKAVTGQAIHVDAGEYRVTTTASERQPERVHAPALGLTHRLLGRFHVTGIFWYRFHYWGSTRLPRWFMNRVGPVIISFAFCVFMGRIRNALAANLEPVLGPAGPVTRWRRAYRTLRTFACCLTERYQRMADQKTRFEMSGLPHWYEATGGGRGAVLVSAHLGPWESSAYLGADEEARIVHVVREEEIDPRAQAFISEMVGKISDKVVTHYAGDDPRLAIELAEALRRGELVALQGDRPRAGGRTITAQIFGKPMPLPVGPAALARAAGVPLLPIFSFREGVLEARTVVRPPIMVARTANRDADYSAAVNQLATEIEWAIRERPYQWFCFKKLWE